MSLPLAFEACRRNLSPAARSDLDQLTARLAVIQKRQGGNDPLSLCRIIARAMPGLTVEECQALALYALCALSTGIKATKQMQETQMTFNLQYLQLQSRVQNENRQFTTIGNIMKTKHDTVKNSISNIR